MQSPFMLSGAWDIANAEELRAIFAGQLDSGEDIVLDLSGVEACDAAALQLICSLGKTAAQRGLHLRLTAVSPAISAIADALGVPLPDAAAGGGDGL